MERSNPSSYDSITDSRRLKPAEIFEGQKDNGLLDAITLNQIELWLKRLNSKNPDSKINPYFLRKIRIIVIQAFGILGKARPDQQNVATTQEYLNQIITESEIREFENPTILLIIGPAGILEGWPGGEAISTAEYLAQQLGVEPEKIQSRSNFFIIPCGLLPLAQKSGLDYANNLEVAKQILSQINERLSWQLGLDSKKTDTIKFEALWTDIPRLLKHIAVCLILRLDFTKVRAAKRVEIQDDNTVKNLYKEFARQTFIATPVTLTYLLINLWQQKIKAKQD